MWWSAASLREAAEHDVTDAARAGRKLGGDRADGDARGAIRREAIDAGRDRRKGDRGQAMRGGKIERRAIARRQQFIFAFSAAAPHRTDGVDDVFGRAAGSRG